MSIEERIKHKNKDVHKKLQNMRFEDFEKMMKESKDIDVEKCRGRG
jgi:hypothetical protein